MDKPFPAYEGDEPYVFVCYAHDDSKIVYPEILWLRDQGINIWYDEGISPGAEFPERLGKAILGAKLVLFYVSPDSVSSRHCRDEVYFGLDRGTRRSSHRISSQQKCHRDWRYPPVRRKRLCVTRCGKRITARSCLPASRC